MKKIIFILSLLGLVACTDLQTRPLTFPEKVAKEIKTIEENGEAYASTRAYILKKYGKPEDMFVLDKAGTEVWKYIISDNYDNELTKSYELLITMKESGKVRSYNLTPILENANPKKHWLNQEIKNPNVKTK